jgi:hypothetical protein
MFESQSNENKTELVQIIPVLPSLNIRRDVEWYRERAGFEVHYSDKSYPVSTGKI